jgi:hypothetical protein
MRIAVLVLGILGGLAAGTLGMLWLTNCQKDRPIIEVLRNTQKDHEEARKKRVVPPNEPELDFLIDPDAMVREYDRRVRAYPFLLAGLLFGVMGGVLAMLRRGKSAAVLLALAALGPAVLNPLTLIFTFLLPIAAVLSLFVRPRRVRTDLDQYEPPPRPRRRLRLAEE